MPRKPVHLSGNDGKPFQITIDKFGRGVMTLFDDTRLPLDAVKQAQNMYLDQDGVWSTRPPSSPYGQALTGPIDGGDSFTVYNSDGTASTFMWVIDNGTFKISQDGGAWTPKTGVTWPTGTNVVAKQVSGVKNDGVRSNILLLTHTSGLCYYDINSGTLGSYSSIGTPSGGSVTRGTPTTGTGLAAGNQNAYYRITAVNAIGETLGSIEFSVSGGINLTRDNWTLGTHFLSLAWTALVGATRYNIYYSDRSGEEVFLDSSPVNSYNDTGEATPNPYAELPATDTTGGPKYQDLALSGNRVWGTRDPSQPYAVGWTGTGQYMGAFNPFYGGGAVQLEKGGPERPEKVIHFRTGKGDAVASVLTSDPNGAGSTWAITLSTLTVDTLVIVIPVAQKQQGSVGTRSPLGVVEANDSVYFPSPKGFHNQGSRQSILNVLVTSDLSDVIRDYVRGLNNAAASKFAGKFFDGRIYWAVATGGSSTNNAIIVHDIERKGAWALPWTLAVKKFFEYTDSSGAIHLLAIPVSGGQLIEIGGTGSGDSGQAFPTLLESGLIHWDKNHATWAYIRKVYVELADPAGQINFSISGTRRGRDFSTIGSREIQAALGQSGFGADLMGEIMFGDSGSAAATYSQPSVKKVLNIKKTMNNLRWSLSSNSVASRYSVIQIVIDGVMLPTTDPSDWKA
jgi:hypothetical protein